jgi:hypothetical protein
MEPLSKLIYSSKGPLLAEPFLMSEQILSYQRFAQRVPVGHVDRIWLGPLRILHGSEKHTEQEWLAIVEVLRAKPAKR